MTIKEHSGKEQPGKALGKDQFTKEQHGFMQKAIDLSERAALIEKSGGVFGAVIVKDGKIIAEGYNQVLRTNDPTWHAEIQAIREASQKLGSPHLKGCVLYTSAECCPMCLAAAYWAHLDHIYYAARIEDSKQYGDFQDIDMLDEIRKDPQDRKIKFTEMMRPEAVEIWKKFHDMPGHGHY